MMAAKVMLYMVLAFGLTGGYVWGIVRHRIWVSMLAVLVLMIWLPLGAHVLLGG